VPSYQNPQSLNRYSYVLGNPLRFTDPFGHWAFEESPGGEQPLLEPEIGRVGVRFGSGYATSLRQRTLVRVADRLAPRVDASLRRVSRVSSQVPDQFGAADAMLAVVRCGARLARNDPGVFMTDVSEVLSGHTIDVHSYIRERQPDPPGGMAHPYFRSLEGSLGFHEAYRHPDPTNPQVHHYWFYVQLSYEAGLAVAAAANVVHESSDPGGSRQDLRLGFQGALLGNAIRSGHIAPREVPVYIAQSVLH
jgi:hypothetical protein